MTQRDDGGYVFPQAHEMIDAYRGGFIGIGHSGGMSLRDYLAGQAIAGMMADPNCDPPPGEGLRILARGAYAVADAMLAVRKEPKP